MGILKNSRHEAFALALSKGETATAAYKLAGYKADRKYAARLTTKDDIAARVSELQTAVAEQHIITQVEILTELRKIGFSRIGRAVRWGGRRVQLVDSSQLDDDTVAVSFAHCSRYERPASNRKPISKKDADLKRACDKALRDPMGEWYRTAT
jgi:hypothetical protein